MNVYFDKSNFISFIHSANNLKFAQCNTMLINTCHLFFNFKKEDINDNDEENNDIMMWMSQNVDGFNSSLKWNANFPARPLKSTMCKNFNKEQLSSVYLLDDDKIETLITLGILLIGKPGNEIEVLSDLLFKDLQYTRNIFMEVNSWKDINNYSSPCSDIIIFDPYLFSDDTLYDTNIYPIIINLCKNAHNAIINIVIFTLENVYCNNRLTITPNWRDIIDKIHENIQKCIGIKPQVTIVTGCKQTLAEHDRTIFTNYKMFSSGDSFNYFNSSGEKITKGRYLNVYSLVDNNNNDSAADFLKKMQNIYDDVKSKNSDLIHKDKNSKSNFLKII